MSGENKEGCGGGRDNAAERKIILAESPKCLNAAKFDLPIFKNSCCFILCINKINQTIIIGPEQI